MNINTDTDTTFEPDFSDISPPPIVDEPSKETFSFIKISFNKVQTFISQKYNTKIILDSTAKDYLFVVLKNVINKMIKLLSDFSVEDQMNAESYPPVVQLLFPKTYQNIIEKYVKLTPQDIQYVTIDITNLTDPVKRFLSKIVTILFVEMVEIGVKEALNEKNTNNTILITRYHIQKGIETQTLDFFKDLIEYMSGISYVQKRPILKDFNKPQLSVITKREDVESEPQLVKTAQIFKNLLNSNSDSESSSPNTEIESVSSQTTQSQSVLEEDDTTKNEKPKAKSTRKAKSPKAKSTRKTKSPKKAKSPKAKSNRKAKSPKAKSTRKTKSPKKAKSPKAKSTRKAKSPKSPNKVKSLKAKSTRKAKSPKSPNKVKSLKAKSTRKAKSPKSV
jgi:DNA polymerase III gamma/tau subunit